MIRKGLIESRQKLVNVIFDIIEGRATGGSATKTGAMAGRYLRRLKHSVGSGETNPEVLRQKKDQAERIKKRVGGRYGGDDGFDDLAKEGEDKFADAQKGGEGKGRKWYHDEDARAPDNAPNPTDVKRRAKGKKPYRQRSSSNIVRGARLALAERVLESLYDYGLDEGLRSALMKGGLAAGLAAGALGGGVKPEPPKATSKYKIASLEDRQAAIAKKKQAAKDKKAAFIKTLKPVKAKFRGDTGEGMPRGTQPEDMGGTGETRKARNFKKSLQYNIRGSRGLESNPKLKGYDLTTRKFSTRT